MEHLPSHKFQHTPLVKTPADQSGHRVNAFAANTRFERHQIFIQAGQKVFALTANFFRVDVLRGRNPISYFCLDGYCFAYSWNIFQTDAISVLTLFESLHNPGGGEEKLLKYSEKFPVRRNFPNILRTFVCVAFEGIIKPD